MKTQVIPWIIILLALTIFGDLWEEEPYVKLPPIFSVPGPNEKILAPLPPPRPEGQGPLKDKSRHDGNIIIEVEKKFQRTIATGTAFSISEEGVWVTAKHVTNGCDQLILQVSHNKGYLATDIIEHPSADISIFKTQAGAMPFQIESQVLNYNAEGFHFGYPRGEPGDVYSRLIGRRILNVRGAQAGKESVLVWAEKRRFPDHFLSLGGISGGPIVNKAGNMVGVHVAGSVRRGRAYSSLPNTVTHLIKRAGFTTIKEPIERQDTEYLTPQNFLEAGQNLRKNLSVAKVICIVK